MRLADIMQLYARRLRPRLVQEALAVVGIAAGVALMFAALVANTSLTGSVQQLTSGIVGESRYQLTSRGPDGFDADLLETVRSLDGVRDAAPILEARAIVKGPGGERPVLLVGGDPKFARLGGPMLRLFTSEQLSSERALALPRPIARAIGASFGSPVDVTTGAGRFRSPMGVRLDSADIGSLESSPVVLAPLAHAQHLSGKPGKVTRIFVQPQPRADATVRRGLLQLADGRLNVLDARADVQTFEQAALPTNQSTALFSVFAALVGFLFALSAVLLTVPQRRDFIRVLQMSGHGPGVVVKVMLVDAIVLGSAGSAIGLLLGDQLSRTLFGTVPGYLAFAFPVGSQRIVEPSSIAIAAAAGVLAACIAVLAPISDIFRRHPRRGPEGGPELRTPLRLAAAGVAVIAASGTLMLLAPDAAIAGLVLLIVALLLVLPLLMHLCVSSVIWVGQRGRSAVPALASMELLSRASRARMFALAATGAVAVFASVAIGGSHRDLQRGLDSSASQIDGNADVWATFPGEPNAFATTPFSVDAATLRRIRQLPDVTGVALYRGGFLDVGDRRAWVLAPPTAARAPIPPDQLTHGDLRLATERIRAGGWIVLSEGIASQAGVEVGDAFRLPSPAPITLRVAAVSTNLGWPPGAMVLSARDYARAWDSTQPSALHIQTAPGALHAVVERQVQEALGETPAVTETMREREQRHYAAAREGLERLTQISVLVLGAAIIAMATAMGGVIWQRRPTLANLKVHGFTEGELWRSLLLESGVLLGIGCLIGAAFGLAGQGMLSGALREVTGFPVFYSPGVLVALAILVGVVVLAMTILALPGRLAVRVRPTPRPTG